MVDEDDLYNVTPPPGGASGGPPPGETASPSEEAHEPEQTGYFFIGRGDLWDDLVFSDEEDTTTNLRAQSAAPSVPAPPAEVENSHGYTEQEMRDAITAGIEAADQEAVRQSIEQTTETQGAEQTAGVENAEQPAEIQNAEQPAESQSAEQPAESQSAKITAWAQAMELDDDSEKPPQAAGLAECLREVQAEQAASASRVVPNTGATTSSRRPTEQAAITPSSAAPQAAGTAVATPSGPNPGRRQTFAEARAAAEAQAAATWNSLRTDQQEAEIRRNWRTRGNPRCQREITYNGRNFGTCGLRHPEELHEEGRAVAAAWIREEFATYQRQNNGREPLIEEHIEIKRRISRLVGVAFDERAERQRLTDQVVRQSNKRQREMSPDAEASNAQDRTNSAQGGRGDSAPKRRRQMPFCQTCQVRHDGDCKACYKCHVVGHLARDCPRRPMREAEPPARNPWHQQRGGAASSQSHTQAANTVQQTPATTQQPVPPAQSRQPSSMAERMARLVAAARDVEDWTEEIVEGLEAVTRKKRRRDDEQPPQA